MHDRSTTTTAEEKEKEEEDELEIENIIRNHNTDPIDANMPFLQRSGNVDDE